MFEAGGSLLEVLIMRLLYASMGVLGMSWLATEEDPLAEEIARCRLERLERSTELEER